MNPPRIECHSTRGFKMCRRGHFHTTSPLVGLLLSIVCACIALIVLSPHVPSTWGNPTYGLPTEECHQQGAYSIWTENQTAFTISPDAQFTIRVYGQGPGVRVEVFPEGFDNEYFPVEPTWSVPDGWGSDLNASEEAVTVEFVFQAPSEEGTYQLLIYVREPRVVQPEIAYIIFDVTVGRPVFRWTWDFVDHMKIWIGLGAIVALVISTILIEVNPRLTKAHSIAALVAFILTTVNIVENWAQSWNFTVLFFQGGSSDWWHMSHILVGWVGFGLCIVHILEGLAGGQKKKLGYIVLACWSYNFLHGILYWGVQV